MNSGRTQHFDAIVVGGGHNGLVAAFYLARSGMRVGVFERRMALGGPCGTVEYFPGHRTSITNSPGSLEQTIAADMELGRHGLRFIPSDPTLFHPFDSGRIFVGWRDRMKVRQQLDSFAPGDADGFQNCMAYIDKFAEVLGVSPFAPPPSLHDMMARIDTPEREDAFGRFFFGSIRDLVEDWLSSEEARALIAIRGVVSIQAGPSTPGTCLPLLLRPLSILARPPTSQDDPRLVELRGSTGFPKGGMGAIIDAMAAALRELNVSIRPGSEVTSLLVEKSGVVGVQLANGEAVRAPIVVSNVNPKTTLLDLVPPDALPQVTKDQLSRVRMRGSAFKIALSLDRAPRFRHARTDEEARIYSSCQFRIAPSMRYMDRAYDDAKIGIPSERPLMWGLCPTMIDPEIAPPGRHLLSVNVWHAPYRLHEGAWTSETRDAFGERCVKILDEHMPGLANSIVDRRFFSPVDLEREYGLVESNIIQGDHLAERMFSLRPVAGLSNYRTPVAGLYLCGSGTWPAGFVSGIPGHNAAQAILSDVRNSLTPVSLIRG